MAGGAAKIKLLLRWTQVQTEGYPRVSVTNFTTSWRDGLAFCAIIHRYRPDLIDFHALEPANILFNNELAYNTAHQELGITPLLDAADMLAMPVPEKLSVITYISLYYNYFNKRTPDAGSSVQRYKGGSKRANAVAVAEAIVFSNANDDTLVTSNAMEPKRLTPEPSKPPSQASQDMCIKCGQRVYFIERCVERDLLYHRSCLRRHQLSQLSLRKPPRLKDHLEPLGQTVKKPTPRESVQENNVRIKSALGQERKTGQQSTQEIAQKNNGPIQSVMGQDKKAEQPPTRKLAQEKDVRFQSALGQERKTEQRNRRESAQENNGGIKSAQLPMLELVTNKDVGLVSSVGQDKKMDQLPTRELAPENNGRIKSALWQEKKNEQPPTQDWRKDKDMPLRCSIGLDRKMDQPHELAKKKDVRFESALGQGKKTEHQPMQELAQEKDVRIKSALWQDRKMEQGQSVLGQDKKTEQPITQELAQDKDLRFKSSLWQERKTEQQPTRLLAQENNGRIKSAPLGQDRTGREQRPTRELENLGLKPAKLSEKERKENSKYKQSDLKSTCEVKLAKEEKHDLPTLSSQEKKSVRDLILEKEDGKNRVGINAPSQRENISQSVDVKVTSFNKNNNSYSAQSTLSSRRSSSLQQFTLNPVIERPKDCNSTYMTPKEKNYSTEQNSFGDNKLVFNEKDTLDITASRSVKKRRAPDIPVVLTSTGQGLDDVDEPPMEPPPPPPTTSIEASCQSSVANTRRRVSVLAPVEQESSLRIPDTKKAPLRVVLPTIEFSFRQSLYDTTTPTTISSSKEDLSSSLAPSKGPAPPQPTYNERRKVMTDADAEYIPKHVLLAELEEINRKQSEMELHGRMMYEKLRAADEKLADDDSDADLMLQWLDLVNQKNILFRRENDLLLTLQQQQLDERHEEIEYELRLLMSKQESLKSVEEKTKEKRLLEELVRVVEARSDLVDATEVERLRQAEEDDLMQRTLGNKFPNQTLFGSAPDVSQKVTSVDKKLKKDKKKDQKDKKEKKLVKKKK